MSFIGVPGSAAQSPIESFLSRFCPDPEVLAKILTSDRLIRTRDGHCLCHKGDIAHELWIVASGEYRIEEDTHLIGRRLPGELIGEQALYRLNDAGGNRTRGATIKASGPSTAFKIDYSVIASLPDSEQAVWHETCARVRAAKLDEASVLRAQLRKHEEALENVIERFVCDEGAQAANAAFDDGEMTNRIPVESSTALIWFSDLKGFSSFAFSQPADAVAQALRSMMDIQTRVIMNHGGQIDKFMGDGLMAFWKAPDTDRQVKACRGAVAAAKDCLVDLDAYFAENGIPCDIRIGLHIGPVLFGDFGGGDRIAFTTIGTTVNNASRYEQAYECSSGNPLGRLRISEDVFARIIGTEGEGMFEAETRVLRDKNGVRHKSRIAHF
ncbi:adenylate/guanylate cyclase protein [Rhizobium sp. N324]|nr:adenylate/guanylate cyclase protein [Rhizobium sp. N324]OYD03860.1 adenylate/guanylate cyclase protein [Rhizobium sp. N4311]